MTLIGKHALYPHPAMPPRRVRALDVEVGKTDKHYLLFTYRVFGDRLVLPARVTPARADNLWRTTCFEVFAQPADHSTYLEFNYSPSSQWAAYEFSRYRNGGRDLPLAVEPQIERRYDESEQIYSIDVDLDLSTIPDVLVRIGLSAVIEERDGTKSYWALAHSNPDKPDFHDPACFTLELPPAMPA